MFRAVTTAALTIASIAAAGAMADDPPSYPLVCQGGSSMRIAVSHDVRGDGTTGRTLMTVYFDKAAQGAGAAMPGAGECAWMDRPLNDGEPAQLWFESSFVEFAFQVLGDGRINQDTRGYLLRPEGSSEQALDWRQVTGAVLAGDVFTVQAYNAGGRVLAVTDVSR